MNRSTKKYLVVFFLSFIGFLFFTVISFHYWGAKQIPPQSWEQIWSEKWQYIGFSILFGLAIVFKEWCGNYKKK